jgi:pimeloyl-ACP methyl ester carboxylesterase
MRAKGMGAFAARYGHGPARVQLQAKDPRGFDEFIRQLSEHSAQGSANTMQGYQGRRPSLYSLIENLQRITIPALIVAGDEDDITIETSLMLKRAIATAGLAVFPKTGHAMNLEEPALFNRTLEDFFHQVEAGRWGPRDARSPVASVYGPGGKP